jgi:hypothetical protein
VWKRTGHALCFRSARNNKSGLAVLVLSRNVLHDAIREKSGKDADPRRVSCKELTGECINVVIRNCRVLPL